MQISVIVPVRNEENSICELLDGLLAQSRLPDEIVIADGGSTDATAAKIQTYIDRGAPVRLVRGGPGLPGRNRNLAVTQTVNEWLAFIDAGTTPRQDWLQTLVNRLRDDEQIDVVYGSFEPVTDRLFTECSAIAYVPPATEVNGTLARTSSITSALMRRTVWQRVGGFPEHLRSAEDLLFMNKVSASGTKIVYAPTAVVSWRLQPNLSKTFKKFTVYARSNIQAGLWHQWQAAVFLRYLLLAVTALPAVFFGWSWLLVTVLLWLLMLVARAVRSIHRNRSCYPAGLLRNATRLLLLVPIIATIDAATFVGSLQWLFRDKFRLGRRVTDVRNEI